MIVVGGFNTAVDKWMEADAVRVGGVVRVRSLQALPGGKGLHVAVAAAALGEKVCLIGIIDALRREWFLSFLEERGVLFEGVAVEGEIRTCLAVRDGGGRITEILEPGPELSAESRELLGRRFLERAREAAINVLSGSLPSGVPDSLYGDLIDELRASRVRSLLDASGEALRHGLLARPYLIKPNRDEARTLTGMAIDGPRAAARAAAVLSAAGVSVVVISLGAEGAVASFEGRLCHAKPPDVPPRNPVGCGDCLLGGLAVGLHRGLELEDALKLGVACGTAKALSPETGLLRQPDVEAILPDVRIDWLH